MRGRDARSYVLRAVRTVPSLTAHLFSGVMDLDLRQLRYFLVVAEELHFTRAAERLFIAQPALSKAIRRLEEAVGVPLFARTTREVRLTAAGEAFAQHARRAVKEIGRGREVAVSASRGEAGRLTVGMVAGAASRFTATFVRAHRDRFPQVTVRVKQADFRDSSAGLHSGRSDVAVVCLPITDGGLHTWVLHEETRAVLLPEGHPLSGRAQVGIADLVDEVWVQPPGNDPVWRDYWLAVEHRDGVPPRSGPQVDSVDELLKAVAAGQGIGLTYVSVQDFSSRPGLVVRPVRDISPYRLALAWRSDSEDLLVRAFLATARDVMEQSATEPRSVDTVERRPA
jgi:DNA-binding transcriptional LysR family regulator